MTISDNVIYMRRDWAIEHLTEARKHCGAKSYQAGYQEGILFMLEWLIEETEIEANCIGKEDY